MWDASQKCKSCIQLFFINKLLHFHSFIHFHFLNLKMAFGPNKVENPCSIDHQGCIFFTLCFLSAFRNVYEVRLRSLTLCSLAVVSFLPQRRLWPWASYSGDGTERDLALLIVLCAPFCVTPACCLTWSNPRLLCVCLALTHPSYTDGCCLPHTYTQTNI